ncbi:MAG: hypothetical protein ACKVZ6_20960 [Kineosporiaceae bacterium]|jgi:hypothetical protein
MPVATVATTADVLSGPKNQLGGDDPSPGPVRTRVMVRTGVDLRSPRPGQLSEPTPVGKVVAALSEMGFPL